MKKIVQVSAVDGTMTHLLHHLNKKTSESNFQVHCICSPGKNTKKILEKGYVFHEVKIERKISPISNLLSVIKMIKIFKKLKPDIVHVHTPIAAVLGRISAKIAKVPTIIYTAHGFYFHEGMSKSKYRLFFYIEKIVGRYFTNYIFTQSYEDFLIAKNNNFLKNKNRKNYLHIGNGIDLENKFNINFMNENIVKKIKVKHHFSKDDIIVSFIGRLVKEKGIFDFLDSYELLKNKNVKFLIIGGISDNERDISTIHRLEKYKENSNFVFTGIVENVNEYLYASDIFCLPSYREGMPRSIIEAMAMKNAVIATNIRGSREEVIDGETGFLVNLNSKEEIANKIDLLVENKHILKKFQDNGYHKAIKEFDENMLVSKQINIFEKVVGRVKT